MNARPKARGGTNSVRIQHTPGPWKAHETETRTAIKAGRTVVAYVNIGPQQDFNTAQLGAVA